MADERRRDTRTQVEKLRDMAADKGSPREAEIARKKLEAMGDVPKAQVRTCAFSGCSRQPVPDDRGLAWTCAYHRGGVSGPPDHVPDPFEAAQRRDYERAARRGDYEAAAASFDAVAAAMKDMADAADRAGVASARMKDTLRTEPWKTHLGPIDHVPDPFGEG